MAEDVSNQIDSMIEKLSRKEILIKSLDQYGYLFITDSMEEAVEAVNEIASEHLEIITKDAFEVMTKIKNALLPISYLLLLK